MSAEDRALLDRRLQTRPDGWMDVRTTLRHFALITYALPVSRLTPHIPTDRFTIAEFSVGGQPMAMLSVVPFLDVDFHFVRLPFAKFRFGQTNHRVYVVNKQTGEPGVWFFGTTLGSPIVHIARALWRIPWHHARYEIACAYDATARRYDTYRYDVASDWCSARVRITDTGLPAALPEGFASVEEMQLLLTHPVDGYFYRTDNRLGTYSVWHNLMQLTRGEANDLSFSLYERLGILSAEEMQHPHSILLCPSVEFAIRLPPKPLR